jgi:Putative Ig domain
MSAKGDSTVMTRQLTIRRSTAAIVAAVAAIGLALAAAGSGRASTRAPALHHVNLHTQFEQALTHVKLRPRLPVRAGIVPVLGSKPAARSRAAAGCTEPNCDLPYGGGPVQHNPHVYLLLWGASWANTDPEFDQLTSFYTGLAAAHDYWYPVTAQYGDGSGSPGAITYEGAWQDSSAEPDPVSPSDLAAEADGLASYLGITDTADAQIVVASPSGMCFTDGYGGDCGDPQATGYCAWHSESNEPFTNMPYLTDAGVGCGENFVNAGSAGTYDGASMVGGHEFAESATDPDATDGWLDQADLVSGGEIADKCAWGGRVWGRLGSDPYGNITLSTGKFAMQSLWSNAAGGCVMTNDRLSIARISRKYSVVRRLVSYRLHATSTDRAAISGWAASGLPRGARITSAGVITGRPSRTGTFHVTVRVKDAAGSSARRTFTWVVRR